MMPVADMRDSVLKPKALLFGIQDPMTGAKVVLGPMLFPACARGSPV